MCTPKYTVRMLSRNPGLKISPITQVLALSICLGSLTWWLPTSLADTSIYFFGGQKIFEGLDAYNGDSPLFSGPAGSVILYIFGKVLFIENFPFIWQVVNLLGVCFYFYFILKTLNIHRNVIIIITCLLLSAPVREMVINNQVTGFTLGLSALIVHLSKIITSRAAVLVCVIPIYLLLEVKPNLVLSFFLYFVFLNRKYAMSIFFTLILTVVGCWLIIGPDVYLRWLDFIRTSGADKLTGYESLGFSSFLFENGFLGLDVSRNLSILLFMVFFVYAIFILLFSEAKFKVIIFPLLVLMFPYIHYLDFISVVPFLVAIHTRRDKISVLFPVVFVLLYLPQPSQGILKNLLIFSLLLVIFLLQFLRNAKIMRAFCGFVIGVSLILINYRLGTIQLNEHEVQVMTVVRAWIATMFTLVLLSSKSFYRFPISIRDIFKVRRTGFRHE